MAKITEKDMESLIEADLIASGYFKREPERYDKLLCLDPELLMNFIIATQPEKWEAYKKQLGDLARDALLSKIKDEIDRRGTLEVLRKPFTTYGVYFDLVYFKPASGLNVAYQKKYQSNIFSVMRQLKYNGKNEKSLDQEGFIKDFLANYTTYKTYFQPATKVTEDPNYDKAKATRLLKVFVELSEHTIERKTAIIIQHFLESCLHEIPDASGNGQAKAMLVCSSRAQAVKYKIAFDKYIKELKIPFKVLVAFSGTVAFEGCKGDYSESRMNGFPEDQTAIKFRENQYKFLIVANKFQTGFDQPLLYAMYVNKKLVGVNAVQTLSRLNRVCPGKKDPVTLDFVNEAETIRKAFQDFYEDTTLSEGSDPDKLYDFKRSLDEFFYYSYDEIHQFARIFYSKPFKQEKLSPILNSVIKRFQGDNDAERRGKFRAMLKAYVRVYAFLSQIISFSDAELGKLYVFGLILLRKLPYTKERLPREVTQQMDLDSIRIQCICDYKRYFLFRPLSDQTH